MTIPNVQHASTSRIKRVQSLRANVIQVCTHCGAPGYWHDTPNVNVGCYAPEKVTQVGQDYVGPICPNCGASRPEISNLGEIWRKVWFVSLWSVLKDTIRSLWSRK